MHKQTLKVGFLGTSLDLVLMSNTTNDRIS